MRAQWPAGLRGGFAVPRSGGEAPPARDVEDAVAPCPGGGVFIWSAIGT